MSTLFVSASSYYLGRKHGLEAGLREFHAQVAAPSNATLPCTRAIAKLRSLQPLLSLDTGATVIGKARSRAFHAFEDSDADAWLSFDDDADATLQTLDWLLEAVDFYDDPGMLRVPRVVLAPCVLRRPESETVDRVGVELPLVQQRRKLAREGEATTCTRGGLGMFAMNRRAARVLLDKYGGELAFVDDDGKLRCALFLDIFEGQRWHGEDVSFCRRVRDAGIELEALTKGITAHAGSTLMLERLP